MVEATGLGWQALQPGYLVAEYIDARQHAPARAEQMWNRINGPKPDLFAGYTYRHVNRVPYYVNKDAYREDISEPPATVPYGRLSFPHCQIAGSMM